MARIQLSGLVNNIVGKLGGSVFQKNQGGLVMRRQGGKIDSNSLRSNAKKVSIAAIQGDWAALTQAQRNLWSTYAIYLNKKQKKNPNLLINGHQLFINVNSIRYDLQADNALFQPYLLSSPTLAPLPQPINVTSIDRNGVALELNLDRAIVAASEVLIAFLSRPIKPTQQSAYIKTILMKAPTNNGTVFDCNAYYSSVYGRTPEVGEDVFCKVAIYSTVSQNYSAYSVNRFTVV